MARSQIDDGLPPRTKRRRIHTKSRTGCTVCKQRHIKCDETRPSCINCTQRAASCHYKPSIPSSSPLPPSTIDERHNSTKEPGRPRKFPLSPKASTSKSNLEDLDDAVGSASCEVVSASEQNLSLNLADFELLHHYYTSTSSTFSGDTPVQSMFRTSIPRMALTHPFVLRLLLALSGQHMRHLHSEAGCNREADRCATLAEKHFCAAVPQVKLLFSDFTRDTCQIAYVSAILVCMHLLARGPMPGLLQGVKRIRSIFGDLPFTWPASETNLPQTTNVATVTKFSLPKVQWQTPLQDLKSSIISDVEPEYREIYCAALVALTQSFEATYGYDEDSSYEGDPLQQIVFRWLYMLEDQMVEKLQQKDPHALIMIGYYAVLLRVPELVDCWWAKGWSYHILKGIYGILEERYRCWLQWPFTTVGLDWEMSRL